MGGEEAAPLVEDPQVLLVNEPTAVLSRCRSQHDLMFNSW